VRWTCPTMLPPTPFVPAKAGTQKATYSVSAAMIGSPRPRGRTVRF